MKRKTTKADYNKLLEILYQLRTANGLRQSDLADKMGVPQSFISKIESGERRLDIMEFIDLCNCLNINPLEVLETLLKRIDETGSTFS